MATKPHNYDRTSKQRQAKRRAQFRRMREALLKIEQADNIDDAKAIARSGLRDDDSREDAD